MAARCFSSRRKTAAATGCWRSCSSSAAPCGKTQVMSRLMDTPAVAGPGKARPAAAAFSGASQELRNFLCLLCDRRALWQLPACLTAYEAAYDEAHGILRATAITAVPMQQRAARGPVRPARVADRQDRQPDLPHRSPRCSAALPCAMAASSSTTASAAVWSACAAA